MATARNLVDVCRVIPLHPGHMVRISITWQGGPLALEILAKLPANRYRLSMEFLSRLDGHGFSFRAENGPAAHAWVASALSELRGLGATDLGVETSNVVFAQF